MMFLDGSSGKVVVRVHRDKVAYFFIAFALYLLIRVCSLHHTVPMANILLHSSVAVSLLASNVPKVLDIPLHYASPVRCVEYFSFGIAVVCFISLCVRHVMA